MAAESWPKVIVAAVATPVALLLLSTLFIPRIIEKSSRVEALRAARLKKSLDIGDHNRDFISRLNLLKTRMYTFNQQNVRGRLSGTELRDAQKRFQKEYTDAYLELDKTAWWWFWDLEREGEIFDLLSPKELEALRGPSGLLEKYRQNVETSMGALSPTWKFLSSSEYGLSTKNQKQIKVLESEMDTKLKELYDPRTQLVKAMAASFAQSQYVPPR